MSQSSYESTKIVPNIEFSTDALIMMIQKYYFTHPSQARKVKKNRNLYRFRIKTIIFGRIFYVKLVNDVKEQVLMNDISKENF